MNFTVVESFVDEEKNTTGSGDSRGEAQTYIYQGAAPPSYWDSPISASQLIITCVLLVILCVIYNYSNFNDDDNKSNLMKPCRPAAEASELVPLHCGAGEPPAAADDLPHDAPIPELHNPHRQNNPVVTIADIETRLKQLEISQMTDSNIWHGDLVVTKEKLERIVQWLNSCPHPGNNLYAYRQCKTSEV